MERARKTIPYFLLGCIMLAGLYMRLDNLSHVQHFQGDQGRDYVDVMLWLQDGHWPLLGPLRVVGDRTIGPGWYYTLAPAMALSGFHPAAGAATIGLFGMAAVLMAWLWIWRTTGSRFAALAVAAMIAFSYEWVECDRLLWNPHVTPFASVALACLLDGYRRRPVPCLFLTLMLYAILPQWHTTGFLLIGASFPFFTGVVIMERKALRRATRRQWLGWCLALGAVLILLYLPPLIYEFKSPQSNLRHYFSKTMLPAPPPTAPLGERALRAADRLSLRVAHRTFGWSMLEGGLPRAIAAGLGALLFMGLWIRELCKRRLDPSVAYLASLVAGYGLLLTLKDASIQDYFLTPVLLAPVLLLGWTAGKLLTMEEGLGRAGWLGSRLIALAMLLFCLGLTFWQLPGAWRIPQGNVWHGHTFEKSAGIARFIANDTGKAPFSLAMADSGNFPAHFYYLLRKLGLKPKNRDYYATTMPKNQLGQRVYVIVRGACLGRPPRLVGFRARLDPPVQVEGAEIYRLPAALFPPSMAKLDIRAAGPVWTIRVI